MAGRSVIGLSLQIVGEGTLTHGLVLGTAADLADQQATSDRQQTDHPQNVTDEAGQQQQTATHGNHQAFEHFLGRQLAARQAFACTQRRGKPGHTHHEQPQHGSRDDQQEGPEKTDRHPDTNQQKQLKYRK